MSYTPRSEVFATVNLTCTGWSVIQMKPGKKTKMKNKIALATFEKIEFRNLSSTTNLLSSQLRSSLFYVWE